MTVCVYGATGWTGTLVCRALAAKRIPITLAGRDAEAVPYKIPAVTAKMLVEGGTRVAAK